MKLLAEPEDQKLISEIEPAIKYPYRAGLLRITDQSTLDFANWFLQDIKAMSKKVSAFFDHTIDIANNLHKSLLAQKKKFSVPLAEAETIIKKEVSRYFTEQDRIRREQEEARRKAAADKIRIAEDLQKAEDAEKRAKEAPDDKTRVMAIEETNKILEDAAKREREIPVFTPPIAKPQVQGLIQRKLWRFKVTNEAAVPREFLQLDMAKIQREVLIKKEKTDIPGIEAYQEDSFASR